MSYKKVITTYQYIKFIINSLKDIYCKTKNPLLSSTLFCSTRVNNEGEISDFCIESSLLTAKRL